MSSWVEVLVGMLALILSPRGLFIVGGSYGLWKLLESGHSPLFVLGYAVIMSFVYTDLFCERE